MNEKSIDLTHPDYIRQTKAQWRELPKSMIVIEYCGRGDPMFGGSADDRVMLEDGRIREPLADRGKTAEFATIEEAHAAALRVPNRRPNSILGISPRW